MVEAAKHRLQQSFVRREATPMEKIRRNYLDIAPAGPTYNRAIRSGN
jgi:hypothetical protein